MAVRFGELFFFLIKSMMSGADKPAAVFLRDEIESIHGDPHDTFPSVKRVSRIDEKGGVNRPKQRPHLPRGRLTCTNPWMRAGYVKPRSMENNTERSTAGKTVAWAGPQPAFFTTGNAHPMAGAAAEQSRTSPFGCKSHPRYKSDENPAIVG